MSKLEKQTTLFVNYSTLKKISTSGKKIDYATIGVELNQKIALNKFLFSDTKVIKKPFCLMVIKNTFNPEKTIIIDYIIEDIIIRMKQLGRSERTISAVVGELATFVSWSNIEKIDFIKDITFAQKAFYLYTQHLRYKIRDGSYSQSTASKKHTNALKMMKSIHHDNKNIIASGIKMIHRVEAKHTEKSSDEDRTYHFKAYTKLFNEISDFLLNNKKYPYKLSLHKKDMWLVPQQPMFLAGHSIYHLNVFDHHSGESRSTKELVDNFSYASKNSANALRNDFIRRLKRNNTDMKTAERLELATIALKAYYMTFIAITAMNDSTAATLPWKDEYTIEKKQYKFRNRKHRAQGKVVEYEIEKKFAKSFQKFVKIREFILNGHKCKYLFFKKYGNNSHLSSVQISGHFAKEINNYMIKKIDPNLPKIGARKMRVNKIITVRKRKGSIAAAQSSQSSLQTTNQNYSSESEESSTEQITGYFKHFNQNIICTKEEGTNISVGQCREIDNPKPIASIDGIEIDCKQAEGCLFCEKFATHADEIDIRKLHSLHFIIEETRSVARDENHFLSIYKAVLVRIDNIFSEINKLNKDMVDLIDKIKHDVFEHEKLDPYWEHKLTMLVEIGVLK